MILVSPMTQMSSKIEKQFIGSVKIYKIILVGVVCCVVMVFSGIVLARANDSVGEAANKRVGAFCKLIAELSSRIDQRLTAREAKIEERRAERTYTIAEHWQKRDEKKEEVRTRWSENREEHFAKLEEKLGSDAKKQALAQFRIAATEAIKVRQEAINKGIDEFRLGVQNAIAERKKAVDDAKKVFKDAINAAFAKAKTDCENGIDSATVRTNLQQDLKAAKDKYKSDIQNIEKLQVKMKELIAAKKAATEKAIADFKAALEEAKADFKAALAGIGEGDETGGAANNANSDENNE